MNDDTATDTTPAWFTPPDHGVSAPPRSAPVQAPPAAPVIPTDTFAVTRPGETHGATRPAETFAVTPPNAGARPATQSAVDFWPVESPAAQPPPAPPAESWPAQRVPLTPLSATPSPAATAALAPPTPLVRPIITVSPPAPRSEHSLPSFAEPEPQDDSGGRGWRVRGGHTATFDEEPARPTGIFLNPLETTDDPATFVMPLMPWEKRQGRRPTRRYVLFGVGLFALCGLAALTLTTVGGFGHGIHQPQTIGGLTQVDTPSVQTTLDSLQAYEQQLGASNVVTGAYGAQDQTQMMLVVVQGSMLANGGTPRALQGFVHGIATGASTVGWTLEPAKITTNTVDGTKFECDEGPASANGGAILSMCAWTDPGVAGAVVDITGQPLTDVLNETVQARAASER